MNLLKRFNNFFRMPDKWRSLGMVNPDQAHQMIAKSDTLKMRGQGQFTELFTCVPKRRRR